MLIKFDLKLDRLNAKGIPCVRFWCEHCTREYNMLLSYVVLAAKHGSVDPHKPLEEAIQDFVNLINKGEFDLFGDLDKHLRLMNLICKCDLNPSGLVGQYFNTNSNYIDREQLHHAIDDIRLNAFQNGNNPQSPEVESRIVALSDAVIDHNLKVLFK